MKTLIIYYSRTGNTKHVAEMLAQELGADIEEIKDKADRKGIIGYFKAGFQASRGRHTDIENLQKDINNYDTLVIGQPVWAWTMVPAIRALLTRHSITKHRVALFCTMGGSGHEKCFEETIKMMPGATIIASQAFVNPMQLKSLTDRLVKDFAQKIRDSMPPTFCETADISQPFIAKQPKKKTKKAFKKAVKKSNKKAVKRISRGR